MTDEFIDVNVSLSRWPTRRLPADEPQRLAAKLRGLGVTEAWAGSFDGLLHKDIAAVNVRLVADCRAQKEIRLVPFGSINPMLPDWEEDLRRCAEDHRMPGVRLHPNYHGYKLDHPAAAKLLKLAADRRMVVAVALGMEDERAMHPLLRVPPVDPAPLAGLVARTPGLRLVLLNARRAALFGEPMLTVMRAGDVSVDISQLEGVAGVAELLGKVSPDRVLFGSHAPLHYPEAAALKLTESPLTAEQLSAVRRGNARRLSAR